MIGGAFFERSAPVIGDGSDTVATGFRQSNAVGFVPQMAAVPLPAGLPMLFAGLLGLAALRRAGGR